MMHHGGLLVHSAARPLETCNEIPNPGQENKSDRARGQHKVEGLEGRKEWALRTVPGSRSRDIKLCLD